MNNALSGELSSDAMSMCSTERLPRSKKRKTLANLALMISELEDRTTGLSPLLSMGSDFIMSGMPILGLS